MPEKEDDTPELRLDIDRLRLDEEWINQPQQFHVWSKQVADCQLAYDQAKAKLDVAVAEISQGIRADGASFGIDKVTEKAIEQAIPLQPEHVLAIKKVNETRHALEIARAAVNALEHRKRALSLLVELFIRDYYADPSPRPRSEKGEEYEKEMIRGRGRRRVEEQQDGDASGDE